MGIRDEQISKSRKKNKNDMYVSLFIGFVTWVLIAAVFFLSVRWLIRTGVAQRDDVVENPPVAPSLPVQQNDPKIPVIEYDDNIDYAKLAPDDELYVGVVSTLVTVGFSDFSDISSISEERLLSFGVWQVLKSSRYEKGLSYGEDRVYVGAEYVERAISEELGYTKSITHQTVSLYGEFKYDMLSDRYFAPSYGIPYGTLPVVRTCVVQNDKVTLVVDCYPMSQEEEDSGSRGNPTSSVRFVIDISGDVAVVKSMQTVS